ncbi:MAG: hypothetical protein FWC41_03365 [Firmicutes bacterium]|nr:hypothetical protein [Bacillota bacterium]
MIKILVSILVSIMMFNISAPIVNSGNHFIFKMNSKKTDFFEITKFYDIFKGLEFCLSCCKNLTADKFLANIESINSQTYKLKEGVIYISIVEVSKDEIDVILNTKYKKFLDFFPKTDNDTVNPLINSFNLGKFEIYKKLADEISFISDLIKILDIFGEEKTYINVGFGDSKDFNVGYVVRDRDDLYDKIVKYFENDKEVAKKQIKIGIIADARDVIVNEEQNKDQSETIIKKDVKSSKKVRLVGDVIEPDFPHHKKYEKKVYKIIKFVKKFLINSSEIERDPLCAIKRINMSIPYAYVPYYSDTISRNSSKTDVVIPLLVVENNVCPRYFLTKLVESVTSIDKNKSEKFNTLGLEEEYNFLNHIIGKLTDVLILNKDRISDNIDISIFVEANVRCDSIKAIRGGTGYLRSFCVCVLNFSKINGMFEFFGVKKHIDVKKYDGLKMDKNSIADFLFDCMQSNSSYRNLSLTRKIFDYRNIPESKIENFIFSLVTSVKKNK